MGDMRKALVLYKEAKELKEKGEYEKAKSLVEQVNVFYEPLICLKKDIYHSLTMYSEYIATLEELIDASKDREVYLTEWAEFFVTVLREDFEVVPLFVKELKKELDTSSKLGPMLRLFGVYAFILPRLDPDRAVESLSHARMLAKKIQGEFPSDWIGWWAEKVVMEKLFDLGFATADEIVAVLEEAKGSFKKVKMELINIYWKTSSIDKLKDMAAGLKDEMRILAEGLIAIHEKRWGEAVERFSSIEVPAFAKYDYFVALYRSGFWQEAKRVSGEVKWSRDSIHEYVEFASEYGEEAKKELLARYSGWINSNPYYMYRLGEELPYLNSLVYKKEFKVASFLAQQAGFSSEWVRLPQVLESAIRSKDVSLLFNEFSDIERDWQCLVLALKVLKAEFADLILSRIQDWDKVNWRLKEEIAATKLEHGDIVLLDELLKDKPASKWGLLAKAIATGNLTYFEEAEEYANPQDTEFYKVALKWLKSIDLERAVDIAERIYLASKVDIEFVRLFAQLLKEAKLWEKIEIYFADNHDVYIRMFYAVALMNMNKMDELKKILEELPTTQPIYWYIKAEIEKVEELKLENYWKAYNLGLRDEEFILKFTYVLYNNGFYQEAVKILEESLDVENNVKALKIYALCIYAIGDKDKFKYYASKVAEKIKEKEVLKLLLKVYLEDEAYQVALDYANKLSTIPELDVEAYLLIAKAYWLSEKLEEAEKWIDVALEKGCESDECLEVAADIKYRLSKYEEASIIYEELSNRHPEVTAYLKRYAECMLALGKEEEALRYLEAAFDIDPADIDVVSVLTELLEGKGNWQRLVEIMTEVVGIYPEDIDFRNKLAEALENTGQLDKAISQWRWLWEKTSQLKYLVRLGKAYLKGAKFDEALECFNQVLEREPNNLEVLAEMGKMELHRGNITKAKEYFKKVLDLDPTNTVAMYELAKIYKTIGMIDEAVEILERLRGKVSGSDKVDVLKELANLYRLNGKYDEAVAVLRELAEEHPEEEILFLLGKTYLEMEEYDKALEYLQKVTSLNMRANYLFELGRAYYHLKKYDEAAEVLLQVLAVDPDYYDVYALLGKVYEAKGNMEEAERIYEKALKVDEDYQLLVACARVKRRLGKLEEAKNYYLKAFWQNPANQEVMFDLLKVLDEMKDWDTALKVVEQAIETLPRSPLLRYLAGVYSLRLGDTKGAYQYLKEAVNLNPEYVDALYELGRIALEEGRLVVAKEYVERILKIFPSSGKAHWLKAQILEKEGNKIALIEELKQVVRLEPSIIEAKKKLGFLYEESGLLSEAARLLEEYWQLSQDRDVALKLAEIHQKLGNYERAEYYLEVAKNFDEESEEYNYKMAKMYFERQDYSVAYEYATKVWQIAGDEGIVNKGFFGEILRILMVSAYALAKFDEVYQLGKRFFDQIVDNRDLLLRYMESAYKVGDNSEFSRAAIHYFEKFEDEERALDVAMRLIELNMFEQASQVLKEYNSSQARVLRIYALWKMGERQEAKHEMMSLQKVVYLDKIAEIIVESEDPELYKRFAKVFEVAKNAEVLELIAPFAERMGDVKRAYIMYKKLAEHKPFYLVKAIETAERLGLDDDVVLLKKKLMDVSTDDPSVKLELASLYINSGKEDEAASILNTVEFDGLSVEEKLRLAKMLVKLKLYEKALEVVDSISDDEYEVVKEKLSLLKSVDIELAVEYAQKMLEKYPDLAEELVILYIELGDVRSALEYAEFVKNEEINTLLEAIRGVEEDPVSAAEVLKKYYRGNNLLSYYYALSLYKQGKYDEAIEVLEKLPEKDKRVSLLLARVYAAKEDKVQSYKWLDYHRDETDPEWLIVAGEVHSKFGDLTEAANYFSQVEEFVEGKVELYESIAIALWNVGQFDKAFGYLKVAMREEKLTHTGMRYLLIAALAEVDNYLFESVAEKLIEGNWEDKLLVAKLSAVKGEYESAMELLEEVLRLQNRNVNVAIDAAFVYMGVGMLDRAQEIVDSWLGVEENEKLMVLKALIAAKRGDIAQAKAYADKMIEKFKNITAYMMLPEIYYEMGMYDQAVAELKKLEQESSDDRIKLALAKTYVRLAEKMGEEMFIEEAEKKLAEVVNKDHMLYSFIKAEIAFYKNDIEEAVRSYKIAVYKQPFSFECYTKYMEVRNIWFEKKVEERLNSARVFLDKGLVESAKLELEEVLKIDPNNFTANLELAKILIKENALEEALEHLERCVSSNPAAVEVRLEYAKLLFKQGKFDKSLEEVEEVLGLDPTNAQARLLQAKCYEELGRLDEAVEAYESAVRLDGTLVEAALKVARYYSEKGEIEEARKYYNIVLANEPNNREALDWLAKVQRSEIEEKLTEHFEAARKFEEEGELSKALLEYEAVVDIDPTNIEAREKMATIFEQQEEYNQAAFEYERAFENSEGEKKVYFAKKIVTSSSRAFDHARASQYLKWLYQNTDLDFAFRAAWISEIVKAAFAAPKVAAPNYDDLISLLKEKVSSDSSYNYDLGYLMAYLPTYTVSEDEIRSKGIHHLRMVEDKREAKLALADALRREENFDEALQILEEMSEEEEILVLKAHVLETMGEFVKAQEVYEKLYTEYVDPAYLEKKTKLLKYTVDQNEREKLFRQQKAKLGMKVKKNMEDPLILLEYCLTLLALAPLILDEEDVSTIEGYLKQAISLEPELKEAYFALRDLYQREALSGRRKYEDAMSIMLKIAEKFKNDARVKLELGNTYNENIERNAKNEAIDAYREALKIEPNYIDARFKLAGVYRIKGMVEEAKEEYEKVLEIDPASRLAKEARNAIVHIEKSLSGMDDIEL